MILRFNLTITNNHWQATSNRQPINNNQQPTMTTTQQIVNQFTTNVDTEKEYTRAELGKILTQVYHEITSDKKVKTEKKPKKAKKEKSDDEEPKKKREPTAYNLFVKEQMPLIKEEFPELSRQDLMRKVGEAWKASKE